MKAGRDFIGVGAVFYCHDGEGGVLLNLRGEAASDENGRWDIGGGKLEFGESVDEALVREIREEYLTEVLEKEFLGFRDVHREHEGKPTHWIALDFKVRVAKEKAGNGEPNKFDDVKWFPKESLPSPLHSQLPVFLAKYAPRL